MPPGKRPQQGPFLRAHQVALTDRAPIGGEGCVHGAMCNQRPVVCDVVVHASDNGQGPVLRLGSLLQVLMPYS